LHRIKRTAAVGTLPGFTAIFVICALGVMGGQDHRAIGLEWLTVSAVAAVIYVYGYIQAIRFGGSSVGLRPYRLVGGTVLHIMEIVGAALLLSLYAIGVLLAGAFAFARDVRGNAADFVREAGIPAVYYGCNYATAHSDAEQLWVPELARVAGVFALTTAWFLDGGPDLAPPPLGVAT